MLSVNIDTSGVDSSEAYLEAGSVLLMFADWWDVTLDPP